MEREAAEKIVSLINGSRLSSIQFVLDYLIFGFDERGALTSLVWPTLLIENAVVMHGDEGYYDKICKLIGNSITESRVLNDLVICIDFKNKAQIQIDLSKYSLSGERAIFSGPKNLLIVI